MSPIASLSPTSAASPLINTRAHGHKHGVQPDSADAPAGALQNLFGSLLQSAEKVIGLHAGPASALIGAAAVSSNKQQRNGSQTPMSPGRNTINATA
jgi:hypothetical protein